MTLGRTTWLAWTLGALIAAAPMACLTVPRTAHAERDIKAELAASKAAQLAAAAKAKKLAAEVSGLKGKLVKASGQLRTAETSLADSDRKLGELQKKRAALLKGLYQNESSLQDLLGAARRYERTPTTLMLLQEPPLDAARTSHLMKTLLPTLHAQSQEARADLAELSRVENDLNAEKDQNQKELANYNNQQDELNKLLADRQDIYKKTEESRKAQEREVAKLAQEAKNLEDLVAKIRQKPKLGPAERDDDLDDDAGPVADGAQLAAGTLPAKASRYTLPSHMIQPVSGSIRTGFGEKDDLGAMSKGVTFATRPGATVVTPLAGRVRFAGAFQKYRHILIIEHRGGYHSLIAGLGRIDTVVGAKLAAGEPVGVSESAPDQSLIYYELRQNGQPVNPQKLTDATSRNNKEKT